MGLRPHKNVYSIKDCWHYSDTNRTDLQMRDLHFVRSLSKASMRGKNRYQTEFLLFLSNVKNVDVSICPCSYNKSTTATFILVQRIDTGMEGDLSR